MLLLSVADTAGPNLALASASTSVLVAALATTMAVIAFRAASRRGNPGLRLVGWAFVLFAVKNIFSAVNVGFTHYIRHDAIELVLSLFDLAILALLFAPLMRRRRR